MNEIFLIMTNPTGYDDSPEEIGFVLDEETAKNLIARISEEYRIAEKFSEILWTARQKYRDALPKPDLEESIEIPRWNPGLGEKDITVEMREERKRLTDLQEEIAKRNSKKSKAFENMVEENMRHVYDSIPQSCRHYFNQKFYIRLRLYEPQPYTYRKVSKI